MNLKLRSYQEDAIQAINDGIERGINKPVLVLATGLGKTIIFAHLIDQRIEATGKKALVLAHREELLTQAKDKLLKVNPNLRVSIEMANKYADDERSDVIVASVATLGRENSKRIERFNPQDFSTIVIDEAHHASAQSYKNILKHFGVLKPVIDPMTLMHGEMRSGHIYNNGNTRNKDCLLLGVTATPSRNDNEGIDKIFDDVVYNYGIIDGVQDGWLSRIHAYRIDTKTSLENVHTLAGDFKQDELADAINNAERNDLIVKTYMEQFEDKQALVFAIDIAHMEALTKAFHDKGISVAAVDGSTPKDIRPIILNKFHTKETNVLVNCMVLTEGYDNDTIDVIMLARPTKSGILYSQMVGRGTRTHHAKPYLTICDFVDNTYKHSIKTSASLLGIDGMVNFQGTDIIEGLEEINKIRELNPDYNLDRLDFDRLDYVMEEVDLMGGLDIPKDLNGLTEHSWMRYGEDAYRLGTGDNRYFVVRQSVTGQWKATMEWWNATKKEAHVEVLGETESLSSVISRMDNYIANNYPDALKLVNMGARWRKDKPTEKQIAMLQRLGVAPMIIEQLDKGKASQLTNKLFATKRYYAK